MLETSACTVIGGRGFLGREVVRALMARGVDVRVLRHDEVAPGDDLGLVVYCSGIAWGAALHPEAAYEVHARCVERILSQTRCSRVVYVSSTRVYDSTDSTEEGAAAVARPTGDTYVDSKLEGEDVVLQASPRNRVVRVSNLYGGNVRSGLFLSDILLQAVRNREVRVRTSRKSSKDYVAVEDAARLITRIAFESKMATYNVAAGRNTTHGDLFDALESAIPGLTFEIPPNAPTIRAPQIDVTRALAEFPFEARSILNDIPKLVQIFREYRRQEL